MSSLTLITLHAVAIGGSFLIAYAVDRIRQRRARAMVLARSIAPEQLVGNGSPWHRSAGTTGDDVLEMPGRNVLEMPGRTDPVRSLYRTLPQEIV
jgi:hypothetical protein